MKFKSLHSSLPLASALVALVTAQSTHAADGTWGANANTAWYTSGNWVSNTIPGLQGAAASNTDIANFNNTYTGTTPGINMGANSLNLGAISIASTRTTATNIGNSSATGGVLRLYGATVNGVANVILRNAGTGLLHIQATQTGTMGVVLSNATNNIVNIDGTGRVLISSNISESAAGYKLTKDGTGTGPLVLGGTNTYTGGTQVNTGTLSFRITAARSSTGTHTFATGTALGLGFGLAGQYSAAEIQQAFGLTSGYSGNLANIAIGNTNNISIDTTGAAATLSANIGPSARGLEKIDQGSNLTLTGANQYSGRTVVNGGSAMVVNALGNIADTSSNVGTNSTIDLMAGARIDISAASSSDKNFNLRGSAVIFPGAAAVTLSGSISTETAGAKTLTLASNAALAIVHTVSGVISNGSGTLSLTKGNAGRVVLSGANTFSGATTVTGGILSLDNSLALQNSALDTTNIVTGTASVGLRTTVTALTFGGLNNSGIAKNLAALFTTDTGGYNSVTALTLNPGTGATPSYSGVIANGAAGMTLTKSGLGTQTLSGVNTYTGNTTITGGTLAISGTGTIASTPRIQINSTTTLSVTGVTGSTFTLGAAQTLAGNGTILATGKTLVASGTLSPGASPGTLTQDGGSMQLGVGGDYNWQILDAGGTAGTGYDTTSLINSASIDLSLLSVGNTYNINLWSLASIGPDVNGDATFNNTLAYSWTLFSTGTAITGFSTDKFTLNTSAFNGTSGFSNALGGGAFSLALADSDTNINLIFTPVPEPSSLLLGGLGALALLRRRRA